MAESRRRETTKINMDSVVYGKLPPQAIDIEEAVIGALLIDTDTHELIANLSPDCFYHEGNRLVFIAIRELLDKNKPVDILTVSEHMRKTSTLDEAGGPFYITTLTNRVATSANIETHILILHEKRYFREIIKIGVTAVSKAYSEETDVFDLMQEVENGFSSAGDQVVSSNIKHISDIGKEVTKTNIENQNKPTGGGVPTYFPDIDNLGMPQNGDMVVWAARASMGKTSAMISSAIRQAKAGIVVGIMSMEMSRHSLYNRMLCHETGISFRRIANGDLSDSEKEMVEHAKLDISKLPIYIEDAPNQSLQQFRTNVMRMRKSHKVDIVYADHLGKLKIKALEQNMYAMVTEIIRGVKSLARLLDIPIVILVQLSRKVEGRKDMRPMLSDLRDSGAIEEEADQVGLFYRPEYYDRQGIKGFDTVEVDGQQISSKGYAEVNYAKNRNGECKIVKLRYRDKRMAFDDWGGEPTAVKHNKLVDYSQKARDIKDDLPF
jgi:replicative DNA helicase